MKTLTEKRFFHWVEDDIAVTIRSRSGSYGGGSEVLVIVDESDEESNRSGFVQSESHGKCINEFEGIKS